MQRQQNAAEEELARETAAMRELQEAVPRLLAAIRANLPRLVEGAEEHIHLLNEVRRREEVTGRFRKTKRVIEEEKHWAGWPLAAWTFLSYVGYGGGYVDDHGELYFLVEGSLLVWVGSSGGGRIKKFGRGFEVPDAFLVNVLATTPSNIRSVDHMQRLLFAAAGVPQPEPTYVLPAQEPSDDGIDWSKVVAQPQSPPEPGYFSPALLALTNTNRLERLWNARTVGSREDRWGIHEYITTC